MEATDLQNRLARLAPGETLLVPAAEIEQASHFYPTPEERRAAAVRLARWYRCSLTLCGPGESRILFIRNGNTKPISAAKTLGIDIPAQLLALADEVIE
jgi:hypothetical protein